MLRVLLGCFALCVVCGRAKPTERKSRLLTRLQHDEDPNLDHEAFLGPDEAKTFEQLPPQESRRRLGSVVSDRPGGNYRWVSYCACVHLCYLCD